MIVYQPLEIKKLKDLQKMIKKEDLKNYFELDNKINEHVKVVVDLLYDIPKDYFHEWDIYNGEVFAEYNEFSNCGGYETSTYKFDEEYLYIGLVEIEKIEEEKTRQKEQKERNEKAKKIAEDILKEKSRLKKIEKEELKELKRLKRLKDKYEKEE